MLLQQYLVSLGYFYYRPKGEPPSFLTKAGLGMAAGIVGSFVGTPAEVSKYYWPSALEPFWFT